MGIFQRGALPTCPLGSHALIVFLAATIQARSLMRHEYATAAKRSRQGVGLLAALVVFACGADRGHGCCTASVRVEWAGRAGGAAVPRQDRLVEGERTGGLAGAR